MRSAAVLLVALVFGACSGGDSARGTTVEMPEGRRFVPEELVVSAGTTVRFVNSSAEAHTVTAYEDALPGDAQYFASGGFATEEEARDNLADGIIGQEGEFEVTFGVAGTYEYFCIPHESQGMKATIEVEQ